MTAGASNTATDPAQTPIKLCFALALSPVGLRPPCACPSAKSAPGINPAQRRQVVPFCTPIVGPVWTPIDTERALRAIARGRKAWLFVGSDRGGERAAMMYTLIATCRLNDVDPLVWLTDVLTRIADISQTRLDELLPWNWKHLREKIDTAQAA